MRLIYSLLFYLALPFVWLRLLWRARKNTDYKKRWTERLGYFPAPIPQRVLWWHSVSMGETLASIPLIKLFQKTYPDIPILVTTTTPTGSAQVKSKLGDSVYHMYMPYDLPHIMSRFIQQLKPRLLVLMETELWPNTLYYCQKFNIPVLLANARLSEKSKNGYARFKVLTKGMLDSITAIAVQNKDDAKRFIELGYPEHKLVITGSIKFDLTISDTLLQKAKTYRDPRFTWIAASTHPGEEEIILAAYQKTPGTLLILVPRHVDRREELLNLCKKHNLSVCVRSQNEVPSSDTNVFLIDTMGELLLFYAISDIAFVGGSLITRGGHNLLEPAAFGIPVLSGKSLYNFAEIEKLLSDEGGLIKIQNAEELSHAITHLKNNSAQRQQIGEAAKAVVLQNRGATEKHLTLIGSLLC